MKRCLLTGVETNHGHGDVPGVRKSRSQRLDPLEDAVEKGRSGLVRRTRCGASCEQCDDQRRRDDDATSAWEGHPETLERSAHNPTSTKQPGVIDSEGPPVSWRRHARTFSGVGPRIGGMAAPARCRSPLRGDPRARTDRCWLPKTRVVVHCDHSGVRRTGRPAAPHGFLRHRSRSCNRHLPALLPQPRSAPGVARSEWIGSRVPGDDCGRCLSARHRSAAHGSRRCRRYGRRTGVDSDPHGRATRLGWTPQPSAPRPADP